MQDLSSIHFFDTVRESTHNNLLSDNEVRNKSNTISSSRGSVTVIVDIDSNLNNTPIISSGFVYHSVTIHI